jgi:hypothetical protein
MKVFAVCVGLFAIVSTTTAQKINRIISEKTVTKIEKKLRNK